MIKYSKTLVSSANHWTATAESPVSDALHSYGVIYEQAEMHVGSRWSRRCACGRPDSNGGAANKNKCAGLT